MSSVTLKDIAESLGISVTTVSRALNHRGRIGEETRRRILTRAAEMGYESKSQERCLGNSVGIIFNRRLQSLPADPFYGIVMMGIERKCQEYRHQVFFSTVDHQEEHQLWRLYDDGRLHGLIMVGADVSPQLISDARKRGIPMVLVDNSLPGLDVDCVVTDNSGGVHKLMDHLFALGHRRIGFLGGPLSHLSLRERFEAYRTYLRQAQVTLEDDWVWLHNAPGPEVEKGTIGLMKLADRGLPVTALLCDNDHTAVGALKACSQLGIKVPEQLSIVGFDNVNLAEHVSPGLTTVHIYKTRMGELAAWRLQELMENPGDVPMRLALATELRVRDSTQRIT